MATSTPEYEVFLSQLTSDDLPPLPPLPFPLRRLAATHPSLEGGGRTASFGESDEAEPSIKSYKMFEVSEDLTA